MYIFNPEHDLCLANGDIHFVPPQSALAFGHDCASLTKFMQGLDLQADTDNFFYNGAFPADVKIDKIVPWGWNQVLCNRLLKEGFPARLLPTQQQLQAINTLSHRQVALDAHACVYRTLFSAMPRQLSNYNQNAVIPSCEWNITPFDYRIAAKSMEEVEEFIKCYGSVVLKAPLSGSGKGIRFVADTLSHSDLGWCRNLIRRHGSVVVEQRFSPLLEFAMLFECRDKDSCRDGEKNAVEFKGYSLFYASNGMYSGNILASNQYIESRIKECLTANNTSNRGCCADEVGEDAAHLALERVKEALIGYLERNVAPCYSGFVGVDQFIYSNNGIFFNPVVEINLRMTMGLLARNIYDRFYKEFGLGDGSHCFEILHGKCGMSYRIESK